MLSTTTTSTATTISTALVTSKVKETSTGMVVSKESDSKSFNLMVGVNFLMPNVELRKKYSHMHHNGTIDDTVSYVLSYVGSVICFLSYFNAFITKVTDKVKSSPIPEKFRKQISQILPDEYKDEANYETMLDLSRLVYTMVRRYSTTMLLAMGSIKRLPRKFAKIHTTMLRYQKRNKRMSQKTLGRVIKLDEIRTHFHNLKSASDTGNQLSEVFHSIYLDLANVNSNITDYLKQILELENEIRNLKKEVSTALIEKARGETEAENSLKMKEMYDKNVENMEKNYKDGKGVWENIIEKGIGRAKKEKSEAEERLRRYTFRMYGPYTWVWKNDVKLAQNEVTKWTEELEKLREEKKSGYNKDNSMEDIKKWKNESAKYNHRHAEHKQKAIAAQAIVDEKTLLLKTKNAELTKVRLSLKKKMDEHTDNNESTQRLMDAMDATINFSNASQGHATNQVLGADIMDDSVDTMFLPYDLLLDDEDEKQSIDEQIKNVEAIVDKNNEEPLIQFLRDSSPMQEYPMVEKSEMRQIKESIRCQLLENKEE